MALIECAECKNQISSEAAACPHCGKPIQFQKQLPADNNTKSTSKFLDFKTNVKSLIRAFVILIILAAIGWFAITWGMPKHEKEAVWRQTVGNIVSWEKRVVDSLQEMPIATREAFAKEIIARTHPTGDYKSIVSYQAYQQNNAIILEQQINWTGGFSNSTYSSLFQWKFTKQGHISAKIIKENSFISVDAEHQNLLNEAFAQYFSLINDLAEGRKVWK